MTGSDALRRVARVARREGLVGLGSRVARLAGERWGPQGEPLRLAAADVMAASGFVLPELPDPVDRGRALDLGFLISPPGPASGGHTTLFRMVEGLEAAGHRCTVLVYDEHGADLTTAQALIRQWWPKVQADVVAVPETLPPMDAYVATVWQTAHVLAHRTPRRARCLYLAQDYEPYFYPRGALYTLAEESYRFGFTTITIGHMVAQELERQLGVPASVAPFGADLAVYQAPEGPRDGVVFYTKPGVPRRGFELGVLGLSEFHRRRPTVPLHTFGMRARELPFPADVHDHLTPAQVSTMYGTCAAGLALSFTNISLIANELLAAGTVPVVNDWRGSRADMDNPYVAWTSSSPTALADAVERAIDLQAQVGAARLRASVADLSWATAQQVVVDVVERECYGPR